LYILKGFPFTLGPTAEGAVASMGVHGFQFFDLILESFRRPSFIPLEAKDNILR
jgi:hypothetical protein